MILVLISDFSMPNKMLPYHVFTSSFANSIRSESKLFNISTSDIKGIYLQPSPCSSLEPSIIIPFCQFDICHLFYRSRVNTESCLKFVDLLVGRLQR